MTVQQMETFIWDLAEVKYCWQFITPVGKDPAWAEAPQTVQDGDLVQPRRGGSAHRPRETRKTGSGHRHFRITGGSWIASC